MRAPPVFVLRQGDGTCISKEPGMQGHDIIVIGASAGGVEALRTLVHPLPRDFPASLFVVLHVPPDSTSMLPQILSHAGDLPAAHAMDGEMIASGRIYVAPPDQ